MKVLFHSIGNAVARSISAPAYPENYVEPEMGGHEVITFGYNKGADIVIRPEDDFTKVLDRLPVGWFPDLCILWNTEWYLLPKGIEDAPFPVVVVEMDWDYDVPLSMAIVQSADLVITIGEYEKHSILSLGAKNCEIFYSQGVSEQYITDSPMKLSDRPIDLYYSTLFIDDELHPDRSRWILTILQLSDKYNVKVGADLNFSEYISNLKKSKLVFSYHRYGSMSSRILDAAAQGAITVEVGHEVQRFFEPGIEYIPANESNFLIQIDSYLQDNKKLQQMSNLVYTKVKNDFEAKKRFLMLIEYSYNFLKKQNNNRRPFQKLSEADKAKRRGEVLYYSAYRPGNIKAFFLDYDISYFLTLSIQELRKAMSLAPSPRSMTDLGIVLASYAEALLREGEVVKADEIEKEALSIYTQAISIDPSYFMAWYNLGLLHFRRKKYQKAEKTLIRALEVLDSKECNLDIWVLHNRDYELFNKMIRKSLNTNLLLFCKGEQQEALRNIRKLYRGIVLYLLSVIDEDKGKLYESLEKLMEAFNLLPQCGQVAKHLARMLALLGFKDDALVVYREAVSVLPLTLEVRIELINLLYLLGMYEEAINEIKLLLKICYYVPHFRGRFQDVVNLCSNLMPLEDQKIEGYDFGILYVTKEWVNRLFNAMKKNPTDFRLVKRISDLFIEIGRIELAIAVLSDHLKNSNDSISSVMPMINKTYKSLKDKVKVLNEAFDRLNYELNKRLFPIIGQDSITAKK